MDNSEQDISFEELQDNDHLRVQKRQLGVPSGASESKDDVSTAARSNGSNPHSFINATTAGSTTNSPKSEKPKEAKFTKKQLFDSDLVQLDMFSPFPIEIYDSGYLNKGLQRLL